jgi:FAD binding domain-containing protein/berberine-like enzyme
MTARVPLPTVSGKRLAGLASSPTDHQAKEEPVATQQAYAAAEPGIAGLEGGRVRLGAKQLEGLDSRLGGSVLGPGDDGWDAAVDIWNALVQSVPALVVQPISAGDVSVVVGFAREHGLLLSVKGGGHNIAGTALAHGGLMLDMSRMRDVVVDPDARLAHVGPGCLLRDVDRATQEHGLATVLGFVSETGVAGLTLGGGFGYLARRFGWAADNLVEAEIVTADGEIRVANGDESPDLLWALRGGGGNFGVVTRFTFRLHAVGPRITGGMLLWDLEHAGEVLSTYREVTATTPRELTLAAAIITAPPAPFVPEQYRERRVVGMLVCHSGDDPEADLAPIRAAAEPIVDLVGPMPYAEQQSLVDDMDPRGLCQYWKAEFLPELTSEYLDVFVEAALKAPSPLSYSVIFHLAGALNELDADHAAIGNRDARFISGFSGVWQPDVPAAENVAWVRESWKAIRPFSTGGNYVNFQLAEDDDTRTASAYGTNYERLRLVKKAYDPGNFFRVNRNVSPAA